jgi:hypothetical protein
MAVRKPPAPDISGKLAGLLVLLIVAVIMAPAAVESRASPGIDFTNLQFGRKLF